MFPVRIPFLFFLVLNLQIANAATFVVTSNADSGPGTLREAITLANANGTSVLDFIHFNIADISISGRTINLQTELPSLSSKIFIDGTTQTGTPLGISDARITLFLDHFTSVPFTYLFIFNASEVTISGICFKYFDDPYSGGGEHYAIGLRNSFDIQIGSPGKGNMFSSVRIAITNSYWNYFTDSVRNLTMQSNVVGTSGGGSNPGGGVINLIRARNISIGGDIPVKGNIFLAPVLVSQSAFTNPVFFVTIENNKFNFDGTAYYGKEAYVDLYANTTDDSITFRTFIKNNIFNGDNYLHGLLLVNFNHKVVVQGNKFGTDLNGIVCHGARNHIQTIFCKYVLIGGELPVEQNLIAADIFVGNDRVHILKNNFSGKIYNPGTPPLDPFIKILTYDNNLITGQANPNSLIQLYENICSGPPCIRTNYLTSVVADGNGFWQFPYTATMPIIIATATRIDSSTSEFTEPQVDHTTFRVITNATCGRSNGSITGIKVYQGTHIRWYNSITMQLISIDTNLVNVPAGSYLLVVSNGLNGCPWSVNLTIDNVEPPLALNPPPVITPASCGQYNGSIVASFSGYGSKWLNANYDSIGTGTFINYLPPGTYYLKLWIDYDTSCNRLYGPFIVNNISGPSLNTANIQITPATCTNSNGSIKNITASNVTGTPFIQWADSLNVPVGNSLDLQNVPAGKYRLKFKDQSSCDTIITPYYIVPGVGIISIDTTAKIIIPAGCTVNNGSIQNIQIAGATSLQWINLSNNMPVGVTADIYYLASGHYKLTATNTIGCTATVTMFVPPAAFMPIGVTSTQARMAVCGENNGFVNILSFNNNQSLYTFRWVDSTTSQVIGTGTSVFNLGAGIYLFFATDTNGCENQIYKINLGAIPKPNFDYSPIKITDDQCSSGKGSITGIIVKGLFGPTTYSWENNNNTVVGNSLNLNTINAGQYRLTVTDAGVCTVYSDWITVSNNNSFLLTPQYPEQTIVKNTTAVLTVRNFQPGTYFLYSDPNGTLELQHNNSGLFTTAPLTTDTYLYVKLVFGACSSQIVSVKINVINKTGIFVPTAFSPNNDGKNDELKVIAYGPVTLKYFRIYDRSGKIVFTTNNIHTGWDGKFSGMQMNTGIFIWMVKATEELTGTIIEQKGTVSLIR